MDEDKDIWTEYENDIREMENMINRNGRTCKGCQWCNHEKDQEYFTCGHHVQNFTHDSYCSHWTDPNDPKLIAYFNERKEELKEKMKKNIDQLGVGRYSKDIENIINQQ